MSGPLHPEDLAALRAAALTRARRAIHPGPHRHVPMPHPRKEALACVGCFFYFFVSTGGEPSSSLSCFARLVSCSSSLRIKPFV